MRYLFSLLFATAALMLTAFVSTAHALPLNPIPSPSAAGWNQEGSEGFNEGTPLVVNDADAVPNPAFPLPFCNLFALGTDADFTSEIVVKPNVTVAPGFVPDGDGSTGVHVTINDGLREIKAALLQGAAGGLRLAIRTQVGFSPGIELGGPGGAFTLRRTTAGDAIIEAAGKTETVQAVDLPGSTRTGSKTLEFGTYDTSAASLSSWMTLGLPVPLPVAKAGADQSIYIGQTAVLDGSASFDPGGVPTLSYTWKIDAAPAGSTAALSCLTCVNPALHPDRIGAYQMSLVVNNGVLDSAAATVTVTVTANLPPLAMAGAAPTSGYAPLTVVLSAAGSSDPENGPLSYSWNFGDGSPAAIGINPSHTYVSPGGYTAVVTVTDDFDNTAQASAVITVTAPNLPPAVAPTATPTSGAAPLTVQFTAGATDPENDPLSYSWNFGDGGSNNIANPSHFYTNPGTYGATVAVSDGVNPDVTSTGIIISVGSALSLKVSEAKVECGEKGKVEGKINLKAGFTYPGVPLPGDRIVLAFDGLLFFDVPLSSFKQEAAQTYEYEARGLHVEMDFNKSEIKVARHKILTSSVDNSNGIDVALGFGLATGTDHFVMSSHQEREGGRSSEKACELSYKDVMHKD